MCGTSVADVNPWCGVAEQALLNGDALPPPVRPNCVSERSVGQLDPGLAALWSRLLRLRPVAVPTEPHASAARTHRARVTLPPSHPNE